MVPSCGKDGERAQDPWPLVIGYQVNKHRITKFLRLIFFFPKKDLVMYENIMGTFSSSG